MLRAGRQALSIRVVSTSHGALRLWDGLLTSDWVERRLVALESSYSTHSSLRFAFFTYNVGAAGPRHLETRRTAAYRSLLYDFLTSLRNPDVICFGFQEVIDLSNLGLAADIVLFASDNHEVSANYHKWRSTLSAAVARVLGPHYVMVTDAKLVGVGVGPYIEYALAYTDIGCSCTPASSPNMKSRKASTTWHSRPSRLALTQSTVSLAGVAAWT